MSLKPADSWYEATARRGPAQPTLEGDVEADVCVVGGGLSGCSTALHLAERGYKVVLLEAERVGYGASGRSGGQIIPGYACGMGKLATQLGPGDAKRLWDYSVEGVDITVPVFQFSETHYFTNDEVTPAYKGTLFSLTGKVNAGAFKGFQAGEVLFLGASGARRGTDPDDDWEITFRFAASPNASGISVGDISGISKRGWEYLWVRYADQEDTGSHAIVKRPVAAYVERVYDEGSFAGLGI